MIRRRDATAGLGTGLTLATPSRLRRPLPGIKLTHLPCRGSAPASTDVIAGRCDLTAGPT